jgi:hypothetical protein
MAFGAVVAFIPDKFTLAGGPRCGRIGYTRKPRISSVEKPADIAPPMPPNHGIARVAGRTDFRRSNAVA